jgi:hypothetical protein
MATIAWPDIPCAYVSSYTPTGGRELSVDLQSGGKYTVGVSSAARYRMTIRCTALRTDVNAPSPYDTVSEVVAVRSVIVALKRGDVLQKADPVDGTLRNWKLDADEVPLAQDQETPKFWTAEIPLRSF